MNYSQKCLNFLGNGSKKKLMDKSINGFKKKHVGFLGFLAHLEQKNLENFSPWKFLNPHIYGQIFMIVGFLGWIFLLWTLFTPKFNSVNQQSDPVSSQLSFQFSYAGLWSWEKIKPAKLAFDNI